MTDTTRDLIQRMVDALTNAIRVIHNEDGTQHISTAAPVLAEALAYLDQPEPEELTEEEIERRFQRWWFNEGSGMRPFNDEDQEAHVRRISQIAWSNGAYVARYDCPTTTTAHCNPDDSAVSYCAAVLLRARAALAQPEPEVLTDEEIAIAAELRGQDQPSSEEL